MKCEELSVNIFLKVGAKAPMYATEGASGADLHAYLPEGPISIAPGDYLLIPTGVHMEIPLHYEGQVRPRSGLAAKYGVTVLNSPGTIDSDYRGEIKIILINLGSELFHIAHGDRIAQLVIAPIQRSLFIEVEQTTETHRGEQGFGSTGV